MKPRPRYRLFIQLLPLLLLANGCISPAAHKSVPAFSNAVALATENTKSAFDAVEEQYESVQAQRIVVNYDKQGFNPKMVKHFLDPEDLQIRLDLLDALQRYALSLSDLSGDKQLEQFDDKTRAFGASLQNLTATDAFKKLVSASAGNVNIATTAVNAIGRWFIERKRQQHLPDLISEMQQPVKTTAELLEADIGSAPDENGRGGHGLRDQLWNEYTEAMIQQVAFIDQNKDRMDPSTKTEAIERLPQLLERRSLADETLKETQATLSKLVDTHGALLRSVKSKGDIQGECSSLISEGERIKRFYDSLRKKS
jgi:hypothetical protein